MGKLPTLKVFRTLATSPNLLETAGECSGYVTAILQTPVDLSKNESPGVKKPLLLMCLSNTVLEEST